MILTIKEIKQRLESVCALADENCTSNVPQNYSDAFGSIRDEIDEILMSLCKACGEPLDGQYNNGETHDECASCRAGTLTDQAYDSLRGLKLLP